MSEYQYYEFLAVDRPLSRDQMAELRQITSRATITPTKLVNVYHWGDFKGDPIELLVRYFDAHIYDSNFGSRQLLLAFPRQAVDLEAIRAYRVERALEVLERGDRVVVSLLCEDDEAWGWVEEEASEAWMPSLISLRSDIMNGDLRAFYLGWLRGAQLSGLDAEAGGDDEEEEDEDEEYASDEDDRFVSRGTVEPPIPPGLGSLTASLTSLVEFLDLSPDLVAVAAQQSAPLAPVTTSSREVGRWVLALPADEKDALLVRLAQGENNLQAELLRRFRAEASPDSHPKAEVGGRTAGELIAVATKHGTEREQREQEQAARERQAHLDALVGHEAARWEQVERLVEAKQSREYDEAVQILIDLRDLADREHETEHFRLALADLRSRHTRKIGFTQRLKDAKLG